MPVRNKRGSLPVMGIALLLVLALFAVIGWKAIFVVVGFVFVMTAGTWVYDRFTRLRPQGVIATPDDDKNPADDYIGPDGLCATCQATLFHVEPGKTSTKEIIAFARTAKGWSENPDALKGHMPPGIFCPNGCFSIVAQYPLPWPPVPGERMERIAATFVDLLGKAEKEGGDPYERQQALMTTYRKEKRRFRATMPYRSRFHCEVCGREEGDGEWYFEDPEQTPSYEPTKWLWVGRPRGAYAEVLASELHAVLKHDAMPSPTLATLLANVPEERG